MLYEFADGYRAEEELKFLAFALITVCTLAYFMALARLLVQGTRISNAEQLRISDNRDSAPDLLFFALVFGAFAGKFFSEIVGAFSTSTWWPFALCAVAVAYGYVWGRNNGPL